VPLPARTVAELSAVLLDRQVPAERLASVRRDEERAFRRRPSARPEWIVPALNLLNLVAMPRLVALSSWQPEARLIGPRSAHVNHLNAVIALMEHAESRSWDSTRHQRFVALLRRLAAPLTHTGSSVSFDQIRISAREELALIEPADSRDRAKAARLLQSMSAYEQLWGRPNEDIEEEIAAGVRRMSL
jgi:hypothetical protein